MQKRKIKIAVVSMAILLIAVTGCEPQTLSNSLETQIKKTAQYVMEEADSPGIGAVGGDWAIKGIAESELQDTADYYELYYDNVRAKTKSTKGKIHEKYYSDYARVVIGLDAIGQDPKNVEGYDLTLPLNQYEELTEQGANAVSYALVAVNVADIKTEYEEAYVTFLISELNKFTENAQNEDVDYISMILTGLSFYKQQEEVSNAIKKGVDCLGKLQKSDGSMGNCESTAETIVALTQLGVDPFTDDRFVKKENSLGESLMLYQVDDGAFSHQESHKKEDLMASEKALLAMDSIKLSQKGETLY